MTRPVTWFIAKGAIFLTLCLTTGCGVGGPTPGADHSAWEISQGGITTGPELPRLQRLAQPLLQADSSYIRLALLQTAEPCAYSFKDGQIYVSRGLCALLDDAELTAAIAHELGHLTNDGCYPSASSLVASLQGESDLHPDRECAADDTGMQLLTAAHQDSTAMPRMLHRLASAQPLASTRLLILARAGRLTHHVAWVRSGGLTRGLPDLLFPIPGQ